MPVAFTQPIRGVVYPELIADERLFGGEARLDAIIVGSRGALQRRANMPPPGRTLVAMEAKAQRL